MHLSTAQNFPKPNLEYFLLVNLLNNYYITKF